MTLVTIVAIVAMISSHHIYLDVGTTQFSSSRSLVQHVQLVTLQNFYRLHIFNKLEVRRLDSRLSSFVVISSYKTLSDRTMFYSSILKNVKTQIWVISS